MIEVAGSANPAMAAVVVLAVLGVGAWVVAATEVLVGARVAGERLGPVAALGQPIARAAAAWAWSPSAPT